MSPLASLRRLPRYRDPISRNIARLLLRSLQEQHRAPSHTVVECEARFGILLAQSSAHRHEFPVSTVTAAILDPLHKYLYTFQPGVSWPVYQGVQQGLVEQGIAAAASFAVRPHPLNESDVLLTFNDNTRVSCDYGTLTQVKRDAMMTSTTMATVPGGGAGHLGYSIVPRAKMAKAAVAQLDMCCPEWCADMRFAVATETTLPLTPQSVLHDYPTTLRWRHRLLFHVTPFFTVYMARNISQSALWWYPAQQTLSTAQQNNNAAAGATLVIPCPNLHHHHDATVAPVQSAGHERHGGQEGYEVEVEVHVEALLTAWKKVYGGAAASAYLDAAALCGTTVAGTGMETSFGGLDGANHGAHSEPTTTEARACALAEREDPLLLRVAEDFVALVQFLAQIRVVDAAPPRHPGV